MKKLVIISVILLNCFALNSQTYQWVKHNTLPIGFNPDFAVFPSSTDASGNIILGSLNVFKVSFSSAYYGDIVLKKYNNSGSQVFSKIMTGKASITGVETDASGNIYFFGTFMDTLEIEPGNIIINTGSGLNLNSFLIKLSGAGGFVWKKNITQLYGSNALLGGIRVKASFLLAGVDMINNSSVKKFDLSGNETQSISQLNTRVLSSVDADASGNIYSAGSCSLGNITFGGTTVNSPYQYSLYFVKYNPAGTHVYSKLVEDVTFERPKIVSDASGNVYASGELNDNFTFGTIQTEGPQWVYDFYLAKIDPSGNFLWVKEVPHSNGSVTGDGSIGRLSHIRLDEQNNVYITGFQRGSINWGAFTTTTANRGTLVLKYNSSGSLLWGKVTSSGDSRGDALSLDNTGNIFISGNLSSTVSFDTISAAGSGGINPFLSKLTNPLTGIITQNGIPDGYSLSNYPNPFNPATIIEFSIGKTAYVNLTVYDISGRKVTELAGRVMSAGTHKVEFKSGPLSSGVYFYTIKTDGYAETRRMMLMK